MSAYNYAYNDTDYETDYETDNEPYDEPYDGPHIEASNVSYDDDGPEDYCEVSLNAQSQPRLVLFAESCYNYFWYPEGEQLQWGPVNVGISSCPAFISPPPKDGFADREVYHFETEFNQYGQPCQSRLALVKSEEGQEDQRGVNRRTGRNRYDLSEGEQRVSACFDVKHTRISFDPFSSQNASRWQGLADLAHGRVRSGAPWEDVREGRKMLILESICGYWDHLYPPTGEGNVREPRVQPDVVETTFVFVDTDVKAPKRSREKSLVTHPKKSKRSSHSTRIKREETYEGSGYTQGSSSHQLVLRPH